MPRLALGIEYDGSRYYGWQKQLRVDNIQTRLEKSLSRLADHPVTVICAGRTDKGVHAMNQVIHFDTQAVRPGYAWVRGSNHGLPSDIRIQWAIEVSDDFHARFSALSRTYCYVIYNASVPSALLNRKTTWILTELNISWMQAASTYLIGEQDFSSFRGSQCQSKTPIRYVKEIVITRQGPFILLTITANAFLHHMVRNIVGSLLQVGRGESDPVWIKSVLEAKDRTKAGSMAPPDGLYLMNVEYAPDFFIPARTRWTLA